ncbi:DNA-binding response regulator, LytR/AlgR family [Catalinimonas alkaloidigena]|uniref:DNA-binding response regulator, LytR/AlgR family n=1 Tax=Catalinimonas alkaloidigena TaxID=1075417 RepID=A0A1G8X0I8_9BACT|nr:LytTR family DNA-binding domain-containing protein [Catalinimonas alkaloidigena]SDJ84159.1 DNA-binding response regulator, LytR/AlgR family [Catalinimonas alkaloidigena]
MKIRCLIVDDEPLARDLLEGYVRKTPFLELVGKCRSAVEALHVMEEQAVDLLFLDIQMPELTGMEFSKTLGKQVRVIFTTAFDQYALEGFKVSALDYLLKPFSYGDFLRAAHKAKEWFELVQSPAAPNPPRTEDKERLLVRSEYKQIPVVLQDVLYFEGLKDYIKIFQEGETKPILTLMTIKSLEEQLPPDRFMRVHRSYIINLKKIASVERSFVTIGHRAVPIADKYKDQFQEYLANHFLS